jgi:hypothetical protein
VNRRGLQALKPRELLKNVTSAAKTRQKFAKNRSLQMVNEDFEQIFNAVFASAVVIQELTLVLDA